MTRSTTLALASLAVLCTAVATPAADPATELEQVKAQYDLLMRLHAQLQQLRPVSADDRVPDGYEMVVFATNRPVRIAVTVRYEGKPLAERWRAALRGAFEYFDRDKDGTLSAAEVKNIFADTAMAPMMQTGFYQPSAGSEPTLAVLDLNKDGKVSFDEFAAYYRTSAGRVLQSLPTQPDNPNNTQATESLFKFFDRNGDGKLTKEEVAGIESLIATKDADEDECLSFAELVPNFQDPRVRALGAQPVPPNGMPAQPSTPQNIVGYELGRIPGTVTQRLLKQYDKDGDYELTKAESGFDDATFARLDADRDGKLSGEELDQWRLGPPDLDVTLSIAPKAVDCVAKVTTDAKRVEAMGFTVRQVESGRLIVRSGRQSVEFWTYGAVLNSPTARFTIKQQLSSLFQAAAGTKGHVLDKDLVGQNAVNFQLIRVIFDPADADGDGKLTKEEFDRYLDVQQTFVDLGIALAPAVQTPTLFQLLDENRDGRLSVRELRTAWDRLRTLEEPGAVELTRSIIQPMTSVRLCRVVDRGTLQQQLVAVNAPNLGPTGAPQKGPLWFRKMDRNADGDVSRVEFLGTREEFDAIDADHDGLISVLEAEAHELKTRERK